MEVLAPGCHGGLFDITRSLANARSGEPCRVLCSKKDWPTLVAFAHRLGLDVELYRYLVEEYECTLVELFVEFVEEKEYW